MKYNDTLQCFQNMFQATQAYEWMNDAHAHEMQVQMWKANTWGVTKDTMFQTREVARHLVVNKRCSTICIQVFVTLLSVLLVYGR